MTRQTLSGPEWQRHISAVYATAAEQFRASDSAAQRAFAPTLDTWAANALRRRDGQFDLFSTGE